MIRPALRLASWNLLNPLLRYAQHSSGYVAPKIMLRRRPSATPDAVIWAY
jgi:hypothetical protein